jgi:RNA polymerase sigma-70 factor (ECF subfamily)
LSGFKRLIYEEAKRVLIQTAYREYSSDMVRAMISFSRDEQAARDGVSQAFTKALQNKRFLEDMPEPAMKAWLYAAARNSVVDVKRREKRLTGFLDDDFADTHQVDVTDQVTVAGLLMKLPPALREPVRMKFFERLNATEIGEAMNLPAATVRTRLRRALHLMRGMLQGVHDE